MLEKGLIFFLAVEGEGRLGLGLAVVFVPFLDLFELGRDLAHLDLRLDRLLREGIEGEADEDREEDDDDAYVRPRQGVREADEEVIEGVEEERVIEGRHGVQAQY